MFTSWFHCRLWKISGPWRRETFLLIQTRKVGLQNSISADVSSATVKAASESIDSVEATGDNFASQRTHQFDYRFFVLFDDNRMLIEHEDVHRDPVAHVTGG